MKILAVDDDADVIRSLQDSLDGFTVLGAEDPARALSVCAANPDMDAVLIDMMLGQHDGLELLSQLRAQYPRLECVMMSGFASVQKAVQALKLGAFDYIEKPLSLSRVKVILKNAAAHRSLSRLLDLETTRHPLIGTSPAMERVRELIAKAAACDFPVLITGPSGSGKEQIAHLVHLKSARREGEMVRQNCAAIPQELFESEFFGHEKGAFTGAAAARKGKFREAHGGTLFLDEIGEMPLSQQAKLLRVLEDRKVTPVGGSTASAADFRLVTATNRDLSAEAREGRFREDLYYRIGVIVIDVPPLSERAGDIPLLAVHFLRQAATDSGGAEKRFSDKALERLKTMEFKGNVRELKNLVQRLYVFAPRPMVEESDIQLPARVSTGQNLELLTRTRPLATAKRELEAAFIEAQLERHGGNISHTAQALGLLPNNLQRRIKELGMK